LCVSLANLLKVETCLLLVLALFIHLKISSSQPASGKYTIKLTEPNHSSNKLWNGLLNVVFTHLRRASKVDIVTLSHSKHEQTDFLRCIMQSPVSTYYSEILVRATLGPDLLHHFRKRPIYKTPRLPLESHQSHISGTVGIVGL
jgi:hypothetical protein